MFPSRVCLYITLSSLICTSLLSILLLYEFIKSVPVHNSHQIKNIVKSKSWIPKCPTVLATALCGSHETTSGKWSHIESGNVSVQIAEALVTIKSIILMNTFYNVNVKDEGRCVELIIFSDAEETYLKLRGLIYQDGLWRQRFRKNFYLTYIPAQYPPGFEDFQDLYRPCATLKIFLSALLPDLDSVLYIDTDVILLTNPQSIWTEFSKFKIRNWAAFGPDQYKYSTHHIFYYGPAGLNSGVALFNLTRMRSTNFLQSVRETARKFWRGVRGDQDIFNVYFHYHPEEVYDLNCSYNFMYFFCQEEWACQLEPKEIQILHGAAHTFLPDREEPFLRGIFRCFAKIKLSEIESTVNLNEYLKNCIGQEKLLQNNSTCGRYLNVDNLVHLIKEN